MQASIPHFCEVVRRVEANSWFATRILTPFNCLSGFVYSFAKEKPEITHVPTEPLESLLLHVRKLTMNDAPEHLLKVKKALKGSVTQPFDRELLDLWQKYWRITFIMPQFEYTNGSVKEFMTSYRVYDCFINGRLFHTNDPRYNQVLHGKEKPEQLESPNLFLQNIFHLSVTNLCLAAIGLKRYIDNGCTFNQIDMCPMSAMEFIFWRKRAAELDEQYRVLNDDLLKEGECANARWC